MLAAAAKSLQSCPTLCDPIDGSPPGSPVPGTLQARTLERVAMSFSNAWKEKVKVKSLSPVRLLATPWTASYEAPPPMDFLGKSTRVGCHCLLRHVQFYIYPNIHVWFFFCLYKNFRTFWYYQTLAFQIATRAYDGATRKAHYYSDIAFHY